MIIRRMNPSDVDAVSVLEAMCFSRPWSREAFADCLNKEYYCFYVAYEGDEHIGTAGMTVSLDEADISNVAVSEAYRGQGIARQILTALMNEGKCSGVNHYTLEVRSKNQAAIRLYHGLGFEDAGIRKGFYEDPKDDAIIMWRHFEGE